MFSASFCAGQDCYIIAVIVSIMWDILFTVFLMVFFVGEQQSVVLPHIIISPEHIASVAPTQVIIIFVDFCFISIPPAHFRAVIFFAKNIKKQMRKY